MKTVANRLLAMLLLILVIGALGLAVRKFGSMQWLVENEQNMRQFVREQPLLGWMIGLGIYTAFSMVPGTAGKSVVFGWIFGFWPAVLMVDLGLTAAAIGSFFTARFLVAELVRQRFGRLIERLNRALDRDGPFFLIMLRVAHVPFSVVNYSSGVTSVRVGTFAWTTCIGLLPGTMIFVFVGTRIPTLAVIAEKGVWPLFDPLLFGLLAATVAFPVLIRLAVGHYRNAEEAETMELAEAETYESWHPTRRSNAPH